MGGTDGIDGAIAVSTTEISDFPAPWIIFSGWKVYEKLW